MNLRIALFSSLFIAPCALAMDKQKQEPTPNSGWLRSSSNMVTPDKPETPKAAPQQPAPSSGWGWFRIFDHEEERTIEQRAKAQVVTASWLRTRDTNEQ